MGASSTKLEPLKPVDNVPVRQLFGTWFVIAVMPTIFEKGAHNAIETYSDGGKPGAVDIDFRAWSTSHAIDATSARNSRATVRTHRLQQECAERPPEEAPADREFVVRRSNVWLEGISVLAGEDALFGHRQE